MRQIIRKKSGGKITVNPNKRGVFPRLTRDKVAGYGLGAEVYDNVKKTPLQTLTQKQTHLSIKPSKQRKYISLNL